MPRLSAVFPAARQPVWSGVVGLANKNDRDFQLKLQLGKDSYHEENERRSMEASGANEISYFMYITWQNNHILNVCLPY